jgi:large subunit ribosomal protein L22
MDVVSTYKYARISAQKARDVAREIQGLPVSAALDILAFTPRKGADLFAKTMKAALADAEHNFEIAGETLFVKEATVGEGPSFKRFQPRARGSAAGIIKRTAHLRVVLTDEGSEEKQKNRKLNVSPEKRTAGEVKEKKVAGKTAKSAKKGSLVDGDKGKVYNSRPANADDLTKLPGVGPKLADKLNSEGIYYFQQVANWSAENVAVFDGLLSLGGRIEKDKWVAAAAKLVKG